MEQGNARVCKGWVHMEFKGVNFGDVRLKKRLIDIAEHFLESPQDSINRASQDWAAAKAAYRFFDNDKVEPQEILSVHRDRTHERIAKLATVLAIQDTTVLNYSHAGIEGLGSISAKGRSGRPCEGLFVHTVLAVDPINYDAGIALGILSQQTWARGKKHKSSKKQKESIKWSKAMKQSVETTLTATDKMKLVHVADREADITQFMEQTIEDGQSFLIRAKHNRLTVEEDGETQSLTEKLSKLPVNIEYEVDIQADEKRFLIRDKKTATGQTRRLMEVPERKATIEVRVTRVDLKTKSAKKPLKNIYAIHAKEKNPPNAIVGLNWLLLTNIPTQSREEILEKVQWYKMRWHIENFHKMLKSGCRTEDCRLENAERLKRYIALNSIIAWRLYWLSRVGRIDQQTSCESVLAKHEWQALYMKVMRKDHPENPPALKDAMLWIAKLGGFLGRKNDGYPGSKSMWIGWQRLSDCADSWLIFQQLKTCG